MTYSFRITPEAEEHLLELEEWWDQSRKAAAHLSVELGQVLLLLTESPRLGRLYKKRGVFEARRIRIGKTPYHLYYSIEDESKEILVLALWSGIRGKGPPL